MVILDGGNMTFVQELADECIRDDCGYDPLPQHVTEFRTLICDDKKRQEALAEFLQDETVWDIIAQEVLRGWNDDRNAAWWTIQRRTDAWLASRLQVEVEAAIDLKMGGYIPEPEESITDGFGGAL